MQPSEDEQWHVLQSSREASSGINEGLARAHPASRVTKAIESFMLILAVEQVRISTIRIWTRVKKDKHVFLG